MHWKKGRNTITVNFIWNFIHVLCMHALHSFLIQDHKSMTTIIKISISLSVYSRIILISRLQLMNYANYDLRFVRHLEFYFTTLHSFTIDLIHSKYIHIHPSATDNCQENISKLPRRSGACVELPAPVRWIVTSHR